jgi:hypothetical protein
MAGQGGTMGDYVHMHMHRTHGTFYRLPNTWKTVSLMGFVLNYSTKPSCTCGTYDTPNQILSPVEPRLHFQTSSADCARVASKAAGNVEVTLVQPCHVRPSSGHAQTAALRILCQACIASTRDIIL